MRIPASIAKAVAEREKIESKRRQQVWRCFVLGDVIIVNGKMAVKL
jgi:hypothetical protein